MRKALVTKKMYRAQQHHNFCVVHLLQKFVCSLLATLFKTFLKSLLNGTLFFNLCRIYLQKLADRENVHLSCSAEPAEVIPETSSCCLQCNRVQFVSRNRSSVEI